MRMPRLKRLPPIPYGSYYIALRAEHGRRLITGAADIRMFLEVMRVTLHKKGAELHGGYVAKSEVHLAIRSGVAPVSAIVRNLCHEYARRFNRAHGESGGLFRSHAHILLIPKLRPPQSGEAEHSWNSDAVYRGHLRQRGLITHAVFRILSGGARRRELQQHTYRERFDKAPDPEHVWLFAHGSPEDPRMLGDREFREEQWNATRQQPPRRERVAAHGNAVRDAVLDVVRQFDAMCDKELIARQARAWKRTVTLDHLCSHSRKRPLPMIRAVCASYIVSRKIATRAQTAGFFGCRPETLSAHRRQHYVTLFREYFGSAAVMAFCSELNKKSERPI